MTPIEQIKAALRVDEYAGRFLEVKNKTALCPWHKEKTPSLKLHADFYKCHGCGAGGDVIAFAAEYHGITTRQAVRMLADQLGIPLTRQPEPHPYDAAKDARIRAEAEEWRRLARASLLASLHTDHYDLILPFLELLESMSRHQVLSAYREQRTVEQAALLRASIRESDLWVKAMTPLVERMLTA